MDRSQGILIYVMKKPNHRYFQEHEFDEDQFETKSFKVRDVMLDPGKNPEIYLLVLL